MAIASMMNNNTESLRIHILLEAYRITQQSGNQNLRPGSPLTVYILKFVFQFRRQAMGQMIELKTKDGQTISAHRAEPAGKPRGGLVVIQEIWGVNKHIRNVADGYAADGYLVIAPAIFDRIERGVTMDEYTNETMQKGFGYMQKVNIDKALLDVG